MTLTPDEALNMPDLPDDPTGMKKIIAQLEGLDFFIPYNITCEICGCVEKGSIRKDLDTPTRCLDHVN